MNNLQNIGQSYIKELKNDETSRSESSNALKISLPESLHLDKTAGADISTIKAMDLTHLRSSSLPTDSYWLLAVPIIGWLAFACLKIHCGIKHGQAEKIMRENQYNSIASNEDKINILKNVINKSGPLAWQYRLELARLQLLTGDNSGADATLKKVNEQRGSPSQTGLYHVRDKGLVSFQAAGHCWADDVIKITHHTAEEALLHANAHAATGRLTAAYDSYNEALYYDDSQKEKIRPLQVALVKKMQESDALTNRALNIIEAEGRFTARVKEAKEVIVGKL
jgi:hypothetical protein